MKHSRSIIAAVLFISFLLAGHAFADDWARTEVAYWGASGTASCNNYESVPIAVELSHMSSEDAWRALRWAAFSACDYRGGLSSYSGETYCEWVLPSWKEREWSSSWKEPDWYPYY
ncbi:MAG: hypothetical protein ACL93V_13240 [Candidatus Electrothrix sp. YB6]